MDYNEGIPHDSHEATVTFQWKEHGHHLLAGLLDLFRRGTQVDMDVNFDGQLQVKVHRLVLSVFLPSIDHSIEPVLDLKDLAETSDDVRALMEFIYTGQLTVSVDRVPSLRRLAEALQFHALTRTIDSFATHIVTMDTEVPIKTELIESTSEIQNDFPITNAGSDPLEDFRWTVKQEKRGNVRSVGNDHYDDDDDDEEDCIRCPLCPSRFVVRKNFERHFKLVHPNEKLFEDDRNASKSQQKQPHPQQKCFDNDDNEALTSRPTLQCQVNTTGDGGDLDKGVQPRCGSSVPEQGEVRFKCDHCNSVFLKEASVRAHEQIVHNKSRLTFKCQLCTSVFLSRSILDTHMRNVHAGHEAAQPQNSADEEAETLGMRCLLCSFKWQSTSVLRCHFTETHPTKRLYECNRCDSFVAVTLDQVVRHKAIAHPGHERRPNLDHRKGQYPCDQCGKVFTLQSSLVRHVASVHDSRKPHRCHKCFASFSRRYRLNTHIQLNHPNTD